MNNTLKPCPFCGGEVSMVFIGLGTVDWPIITRGLSKTKKNCECRLIMEGERCFSGCIDSKEALRRAKKDLADAWNRRTTDEP